MSTTPEPGHYEIKSPLNSKRGFSIYSKLPAPVFSYEKTPGPGHYISYPSINANGKYVLSKLGDCPGYKIKESKEYDTSKSRMVPGPGAYKDKENLNDSGKYFNSKH